MPDNADSRSIRGNGYRHCEIFIQKKESIFVCSFHFRSKKPTDDLQVNMPDPIWKLFGYGRLWSQNLAGSYIPDPHPIRFRSSKEGPDHIVQNRAGSDLDGPVRFWPNASGPEASQSARITGPGSSRTQPARYQFPTLRLLVAFFHTRPCMITLRKTRPDPTWFWLTGTYFGQTDPVRKQAGVQESSGPLLANAAEPIRIGCESDAARLPSI